MQIFPAFCFNIDTYRMSPHIYSEWEKIGPEWKHFLCSGRRIIPTVFWYHFTVNSQLKVG